VEGRLTAIDVTGNEWLEAVLKPIMPVDSVADESG
jgi:hypothetical protein